MSRLLKYQGEKIQEKKTASKGAIHQEKLKVNSDKYIKCMKQHTNPVDSKLLSHSGLEVQYLLCSIPPIGWAGESNLHFSPKKSKPLNSAQLQLAFIPTTYNSKEKKKKGQMTNVQKTHGQGFLQRLPHSVQEFSQRSC